MDGDKNELAVRDDALPRFDNNVLSFKPKIKNDVKRKRLRRPKNLKSDDWYEYAALSMSISAKS